MQTAQLDPNATADSVFMNAEAAQALLHLADDENAKVLALIARTHSDNRPDPLTGDLDYGVTLDAAVWIHDTWENHAREDWDEPQEHEDEFLEEGLSAERLEEIAQGAEPTPEEKQAHYSVAEEKGEAYYDLLTTQIICVAAPESLEESRVVYFVWYGSTWMGEMDTHTCSGPWRNMQEVLGYLAESYKRYFVWYEVDGHMPEQDRAILYEWLDNEQAERREQLDAWLKV